MSIAIIISTHGAAAEQLLKSAEMLVGGQKNIAFVNFVPGENSETLIEKYQQQLTKLDTNTGVLFLVDTWGGSPFNAASRFIADKENHEVIAGINIPMLTEIFMERDDKLSFDELVDIALKTGRDSIRASHRKPVDHPQTLPLDTIKTPLVSPSSTGRMTLTLVRIDDRLIHGQVATGWTKETHVSRIIVISDEVDKDQLRKTLLKQVAPPGVSAHVVNLAKAVRVYNNAKYANDRVMLLFTDPSDVLRLVSEGVDIKSVNVGGMAFRQGKHQVTNAISLDQRDIDAFTELDKRGIELEVRKVPADNRLSMMALIRPLVKP